MKTTIGTDELVQLGALATQLLQQGHTALETAKASSSVEELVSLLQDRYLVFEHFEGTLDIDLQAIVEHNQDESTRTGARTAMEAFQSVVEQNEALKQIIENRLQTLAESIERIDHSVEVVKRYYPVLSSHGSQFDTKG